ncbi:HNH endonuclease [Streptomyces sp. NPDC015125]|uniref:HNH endonuclease n=1 Tax=Streptomyces sp. NPDC015125 TaxID=3364938 RepID=UPI0036FDD2CA
MAAPELPASDWRRAVYGRSQVGGIGIRRKPRAADRERIITQQGYKCLYCEIPISTKIFRGNREIMLLANWDHFIPYAYSQRNPSNNWVLACHVCNGLKLARMFDDVEAARRAILPERIARRYESPESVFHRLGLERSRGAVLVAVARPTVRQLEALSCVAAGAATSQAATELGICQPRVYELVKAAARRMGVESREEAIELAIRNGFIERPKGPAQPQRAA